jgi:hypothetical protein
MATPGDPHTPVHIGDAQETDPRGACVRRLRRDARGRTRPATGRAEQIRLTAGRLAAKLRLGAKRLPGSTAVYATAQP